MKKLIMILSLALLTVSAQAGKPWDNGKLKVSDNQRYLQFENGQPFFWLGETGWLLPERLDRAEAEWYLHRHGMYLGRTGQGRKTECGGR